MHGFKKSIKKIISLQIAIAVMLCNIIAFGDSSSQIANQGCIDAAKNLLQYMVDYAKKTDSPSQTAEQIGKFINGSGKVLLTDLFSQLSSLGLNTKALSYLFEWVFNYQDGSNQFWLVNLVTSNDSKILDNAAIDFANKYVALVGDIKQAESQLSKMNMLISLMRASNQLKTTKLDESTFTFYINQTGLDNLIGIASTVLGGSIDSQKIKDLITAAFVTFVTNINASRTLDEKKGARALLEAYGFLLVVPSTSTNSNASSIDEKNSKTDGALQQVQPNQSAQQIQPISSENGTNSSSAGIPDGTLPVQDSRQTQNPQNVQQPSFATIADFTERLEQIINQEKFGQIPEILNVLPSVLASERDINKEVLIFENVTKKVALVLHKVLNESDKDSIMKSLIKAADQVALNIQKQSISNVEKQHLLEELKFEITGLFVKAYEAVALVPKKTEESANVIFKIDENDIPVVISKTERIALAMQSISNQVLRKVLNNVNYVLSLNVTTKNKNAVVIFEKEAIEKIKNENKIKNILLATQDATIIFSVTDLPSKQLAINIAQKQVSDALSPAIYVSITTGDSQHKTLNKPVTLILKISDKASDNLSVAVYRISENQNEIVPSIYISTISSLFIEKAFNGAYYATVFRKTYSDLDLKAWFYESIQAACAKGICEGYPDKTFRPNKLVTRAEFAKMVVKAFQFDIISQNTAKFEDVQQTDWFYPYVTTLYNLGIINGKSEKRFAPNEPVTREEIAKVISISLLKTGKKLVSDSDKHDFRDKNEIANWAKEYVEIAVKNGIMEGRGQNAFVPKANATRAEVVTVLLRAMFK
ncbi:S-layer homology domain-containing protein [Caldicellulosiruptor morganii]|uniref:S-layer homology domain-containing protein n=1 Tax=Caldicellulosiruptor morganii TaxID=1387555 RepID=A0ABY7BLE1_9FIRM|nr:S-layer homology domain-containing protein [Caldicellulosiruptor morganii]WAM33640.1 S-layer homology domain-containing protein [Caldicellulosiruptor morganii]